MISFQQFLINAGWRDGFVDSSLDLELGFPVGHSSLGLDLNEGYTLYGHLIGYPPGNCRCNKMILSHLRMKIQSRCYNLHHSVWFWTPGLGSLSCCILFGCRVVLRNHLAQEAITRAEDDDFEGVRNLLKVLENPYTSELGNTSHWLGGIIITRVLYQNRYFPKI